jgi:hypothetical protein
MPVPVKGGGEERLLQKVEGVCERERRGESFCDGMAREMPCKRSARERIVRGRVRVSVKRMGGRL